MKIWDHYWSIAGSTSDVYSSKTNTLVPVGDTAYVAWSENDVASEILNEAELADVLRPYNLLPLWLFTAPSFIQSAPGQYDNGQLKAYSADARRRKQQGGIVVNGIPFPTDVLTTSALNSAVIYTTDKLVDEFSWKLPDGTFITLDTQGVKDLQAAVAEFGQNCFTCEDQTVDAIDAGTITDLPAIDAAYAAVPNGFTGLAASVSRRKK